MTRERIGPSTRRGLLTIAGTAIAAQAIAGLFGRPARGQTSGNQIKAVGFDAFTIFDPLSVDTVIEEHLPGKGTALGAAWRMRQFEYCWLRTLDRTYVDFWRTTEDALVFAFKAAKLDLTADLRDTLMGAYLKLRPWPDSAAALDGLREAGVRLAYVSNMTAEMLRANSEHAGLSHLFEQMLSTDTVHAYKPDPRAYQMAETAFKLPRDNIVFAAFGGWDAAGAKSFGLDTFWVNRLNLPLEELGVKPDAVGSTLTDLARYVAMSR